MFTIFKDYQFAAAHVIRGHRGKCRFMHGHNYRVRVHVGADELDELGMVVDFTDLKAMLHQVFGPFDHQVINDIPPFDERNTTAELLAHYGWEQMEPRLAEAEGGRVRVVRVEVWENDSACAVYQP